MTTMISALTFDTQQDGWDKSRGFIKRSVAKPILEEAKHLTDATAVILKIKYAGVCGSDRGIWNRAAFKDLIHQSLQTEQQTQRILGHEFLGEVVEAGSLVAALYGINIGQTVSGDSHITCGNCYQCRLGEAEVCQDQAILGISTNGIYAEYVKIPAKNLWPVNTQVIRPEIGAILDPFGNAVHAITKVDVRGSTLAIFGCGQIGLFAVALARHFGAARIIGIDTNPENLAIAQALGAHDTILLQTSTKAKPYDTDEAVVKQLMTLTQQHGVDISLEMAGFNSSVNNCLAVTRPGGQVIFFGIKDGEFVIPKFSNMIVKGLTIHNVIGRQLFKTWQLADRVLADKANGVQEAIWQHVLKAGQGTMVPLSSFNPNEIEQKMAQHPKLIFDMQN